MGGSQHSDVAHGLIDKTDKTDKNRDETGFRKKGWYIILRSYDLGILFIGGMRMSDLLVRFRLVGSEAEALEKLADQEFRHPKDEIRYLLRQELVRQGLLNSEVLEQSSGEQDGTEKSMGREVVE